MSDPFVVLGLGAAASAEEVRIARRRLAKQYHPDTGGDAAVMREINQAAARALRTIAARRSSPDTTTPDTTNPDATNPGTTTMTGAQSRPGAAAGHDEYGEPTGVSRDIPSFTVEALPVETFEALLVVASWIGETLDDDPPYRLDTHLAEPFACWCRLELVPDAGASTVSISIGGDPGDAIPSVELVRDLWIDQLNRYDWD